jgi:hypothetical protein
MDTKTSFLKQLKKAPLWQRTLLTTIGILGFAAYIFEGFHPYVEPASGYLGKIQISISKQYNDSSVMIDLKTADHKLVIYILNPNGVDVGNIKNKDLETFSRWTINYLNESGTWKPLASNNINKLEIGFKRTMPLFSIKKSITLSLTTMEEDSR